MNARTLIILAVVFAAGALASAIWYTGTQSKCRVAFQEEPHFGDDSEINKSCSVSSDCRLPGSYALKSDCPYEMRCRDSKCTPVCPWDEK